MSHPVIKFKKEAARLLLMYQPGWISDDEALEEYKKKLEQERGEVSVFTFEPADIEAETSDRDNIGNPEFTFVLGITEGGYYRIAQRILHLKHDLLISQDIKIKQKHFITHPNISVFGKMDKLVDKSIVIGGDVDGAIPLEDFETLLNNFPTRTELTHYTNARIDNVLNDYLGTMSVAQKKLDVYLSKKKSISPASKIDFITEYEPRKFKYVLEEINAMLKEIDANPKDCKKEKDWQRQIVEFLLLIFPKYVAVLENVHVKDFYPKDRRDKTNRYIDLMLVDATGTVDIIEVKRPEPHQLLSEKPGSRGNYIPSSALSEAVIQTEKYLFHLSKWGRVGETKIQERNKHKLPQKDDFKIRITNPRAMLILGRDNDFTVDQQFDFEIIKRKYANIVDIMTYDDLLRRLENIISMIDINYSKLGSACSQTASMQ